MSGPLNGVRVLEIAGSAAVAYAATLLADLGADVLRVDRPGVEDGLAAGDPMARSRRRVVLNLKDDGDKAALGALVRQADVLLEGFRPGVAERLGFGPVRCLTDNPRLVYGSVTGWGQSGPHAHRAGHDINFLAASGALTPAAGGVTPAPDYYLASFVGGAQQLVVGVLAALVERGVSGQGQAVDSAMVEGMTSLVGIVSGWRSVPGRRTVVAAPFYDSYECADGRYVAVGALEPSHYAHFLATIGLAEESLPDQYDEARWPELAARIAEVLLTRDSAEWEKAFAESDSCVEPVLTSVEAVEHVQLRARDAWVEVGGRLQPAPGPRFSRTVLAVPEPAPLRAEVPPSGWQSFVASA